MKRHRDVNVMRLSGINFKNIFRINVHSKYFDTTCIEQFHIL